MPRGRARRRLVACVVALRCARSISKRRRIASSIERCSAKVSVHPLLRARLRSQQPDGGPGLAIRADPIVPFGVTDAGLIDAGRFCLRAVLASREDRRTAIPPSVAPASRPVGLPRARKASRQIPRPPPAHRGPLDAACPNGSSACSWGCADWIIQAPCRSSSSSSSDSRTRGRRAKRALRGAARGVVVDAASLGSMADVAAARFAAWSSPVHQSLNNGLAPRSRVIAASGMIVRRQSASDVHGLFGRRGYGHVAVLAPAFAAAAACAPRLSSGCRSTGKLANGGRASSDARAQRSERSDDSRQLTGQAPRRTACASSRR